MDQGYDDYATLQQPTSSSGAGSGWLYILLVVAIIAVIAFLATNSVLPSLVAPAATRPVAASTPATTNQQPMMDEEVEEEEELPVEEEEELPVEEEEELPVEEEEEELPVEEGEEELPVKEEEEEEELPVEEEEEELPVEEEEEEELPVEEEEDGLPVEEEEELPVEEEEELPVEEEELPVEEPVELPPAEVPVDCETSEWSAWSECSKSCRDSDGEVVTRRRTRTVVREPAFGGAACGALEEVEVCDVPRCPIDCAVGPWRDEGECDPSCRATVTSVSSMKQVRDVTRQPAFGGAECPPLEQTRECTADEVPRCDVDCVEAWGEWSACSPACRPDEATRSTQTRLRTGTLVFPFGDGRKCSPSPIEERECDVPRCPVDCKHSAWSEWSACSKPCRETEDDVVTRRRTRTVENEAAFGGEECVGPLEEVEVCDLELCPPEPCEVSEWEPSGECSAECGPGTQTWIRSVTKQAKYGGADCPALEETRACNLGPCPVDCEMEWGAWGVCSKPCGTGSQTRSTQAKTPAAHGGAACPAVQTQSRKCNTHRCPTCYTTNWGAWSPDPCARKAGFLTFYFEQTRERSLLLGQRSPANCIVPPLEEKRACPR